METFEQELKEYDNALSEASLHYFMTLYNRLVGIRDNEHPLSDKYSKYDSLLHKHTPRFKEYCKLR